MLTEGGRLSTVGLLSKLTLFPYKRIMHSGRTKQAGARRSTVLSLPHI
jgi:hypothetical protein